MSQIRWRPTSHLFILEELISGFNFSIFKMTQAHWTLGQHFVNGKTCLQLKCNAYSGTERWKCLTCSAGDTKPWAEPFPTTTKAKQQAYLLLVYRTDLRAQVDGAPPHPRWRVPARQTHLRHRLYAACTCLLRSRCPGTHLGHRADTHCQRQGCIWKTGMFLKWRR